jgi:large subunit ribosomal protein L18e
MKDERRNIKRNWREMFTNTLIEGNIWALRRAFKKNKAPIWRALERRLLSPISNRREVNINRLANVTKQGQVIIVPGKILGSGEIGHKLTVCAISISESATNKITASGGKVITINELVEEYPDGRGVRVIG